MKKLVTSLLVIMITVSMITFPSMAGTVSDYPRFVDDGYRGDKGRIMKLVEYQQFDFRVETVKIKDGIEELVSREDSYLPMAVFQFNGWQRFSAVKLSDYAIHMNNTHGQFDVTYDAKLKMFVITIGQPYSGKLEYPEYKYDSTANNTAQEWLSKPILIRIPSEDKEIATYPARSFEYKGEFYLSYNNFTASYLGFTDHSFIRVNESYWVTKHYSLDGEHPGKADYLRFVYNGVLIDARVGIPTVPAEIEIIRPIDTSLYTTTYLANGYKRDVATEEYTFATDELLIGEWTYYQYISGEDPFPLYLSKEPVAGGNLAGISFSDNGTARYVLNEGQSTTKIIWTDGYILGADAYNHVTAYGMFTWDGELYLIVEEKHAGYTFGAKSYLNHDIAYVIYKKAIPAATT